MLIRECISLVYILTLVQASPPTQEEGLTLAKRIVEPFAEEDGDDRLPKDVIYPNIYVLELRLQSDVFETNRYYGNLNLFFRVMKNTSEIKLHTIGSTISTVSLKDEDNEIQQNFTNGNGEYNNRTHILTLKVDRDLQSNRRYVLFFNFTGILRSEDGFYKSSYLDENGQRRFLATTQFQNIGARMTFPCLDEPHFKARFNIIIIHPSQYSAKSNTKAEFKLDPTDSNYTITTFATTPIMPTYLLAFVVSDLTCDKGENVETNVEYFVCSRNNTSHMRELAVNYGPRILRAFANFTGIPYGDSGLTKLHQFAIPDLAPGAMENWGICTYREYYLLWDPEESSNSYKLNVLTIIAHELAHQWFGNLVTMEWWSDVFLNEGWATYFQWIGAALIEPEWELEKQFVIRQLQPALVTDASNTSHAISAPSPSQSQIIYNKAGSIIRMVEHFMGREAFKCGIYKYLTKHKFGNTIAEDLWEAFSSCIISGVLPPNTNLNTVMYNWTYKSGFPLLSVQSNGTDITVSQERFLISGTSTKDVKWFVPITYITRENINADTKTQKWLEANKVVTIQLKDVDDWILLNNQQTGFYRVSYDENLLKKIETALRATDFSGISELHRTQIIDDLHTFARYKGASYGRFLDFVSFLKNDASYFPWYSAFSAFNYLLARIGNKYLWQTLSDHILNLMTVLYSNVPFDQPNDNNQIYTFNRIQAVSWACSLGSKDCIEKAKAAFKTYKTSNKKPDKNLWGPIYCNALRNSENITDDWNFLFDKYTAVTSIIEQSTLLSALGCASNEQVLNQFLQKSISTSSEIKPGDNLNVFSSVSSGNLQNGTDIALNFLINNFPNITANFASSIINYLAGRFTTLEQVEKLEKFINENLQGDQKDSAEEALKSARNTLRVIEQVENGLLKYFGIVTPTSSTTAVKVPLLLVNVILFVLLSFFLVLIS